MTLVIHITNEIQQIDFVFFIIVSHQNAMAQQTSQQDSLKQTELDLLFSSTIVFSYKKITVAVLAQIIGILIY